MLGWQIFVHSVRMVFRNLQAALQIGLVPNVAAAVLSFAILYFTGSNVELVDGSELATSPVQVFLSIVVALMNLVVTVWIFVAWHRFILLEEYPKGWIPPFRTDRLFDYIGYTFLLIAICVLAAIIFAIPVIIVAVLISLSPVFSWLPAILPLFVVIVLYAVFLRLGAVLPAAAIGKTIGFKAVKEATAGHNAVFFAIAVIMFVVQIAVLLFLVQAIQFLPVVGIASQTIIGLIGSLINVSVLTTMYGVFIEKRELA
ncbi:hypothetical protein [Ruegeria sp. MALMAid1280]|uniref:hypothetical protein n=1 Tax=Ruegeria sp. MALMAid1280 TaxID=3411634 RepID=UPI003BA37CC8